MTDTKQPEALRLADEWQRKTQREADRQNSAYDYYGMGNTPETVDPLGAKMAAELRRLHAENTTLQQGYDAARLEIESLHAHIKGLTAERDAAYEVAMMNAKSGAAWAKAAQAAGEYPPLPASYVGGTLLSAEPGITGCKVVLRFSNTDEAEVWFGALATRSAAPVAQGDAEDAEDAARYRWLRRWKGQEHEPPFTVQHEVDGTLWGGDLDAAVDAARKQGANHD